ncbi:hypothetical protein [Halobacillus mangrovi]|uniref:Uncharacterized protein n=1 Tax=Halobacillus mangrovi TaxID=402384 RepID=A0A1W5ZR01_9BACI|nr:hypothetical protein [Halobacillus mangrovi]ARI75715.1 hypothetical protein HM131_02220 [Halobacillus mangrovi]
MTTGIELIFQILVIAIGGFFVYYGITYTPGKHEQATKQAKLDLRTKEDFGYKWLAEFVVKAPWWWGRVFFISVGGVIIFLALMGKHTFQ